MSDSSTRQSASIMEATRAAEPVIVAVADFGGGHRVVLVDHGNGGQREQCRERFARIQIAAALLGVFEREKNLRDRKLMCVERIDIGLREPDLSGSGGGLAFFETKRARFQLRARGAQVRSRRTRR